LKIIKQLENHFETSIVDDKTATVNYKNPFFRFYKTINVIKYKFVEI